MASDTNGKLDTLIDKVDENSEKLDTIETLLVGDVKDTKKLGLMERIRNVEKWIEKREWFEKVIIVAVVGNLIGLIFVLVKASF
jgi:hypothetical protein